MRKRTYRRFLAISLSFFALLVALYIPMYTMTLQLYTQSCKKTNESVLQNGLTQLEMDLGALRNMAQSITEDSAFARLSYLDIPIPARDIYKAMTAKRLFFAGAKQAPARTHMGFVLPNRIVLLEDSLYLSLEDMYRHFRMQALKARRPFSHG